MTVDCTRCGSKIVEDHFHRPTFHELSRKTSEKEIELATAQLCSTCREELWDWVFGDDSPNRENYADPVLLEHLAADVEHHIQELERILSELRCD